MFYFTLIIPILVMAVLYLKCREAVANWEWGLILAVPVLSYFILSAIFVRSNVRDTEYWGGAVSKIVYYEPWDEYIQKTCSYTTSCCCDSKGQNCQTTVHYYDCSYVEKHPAEWVMIDFTGKSYEISESHYKALAKMWKTPRRFVDMHRNYHSYDGDSYEYDWNLLPSTVEGISYEKSYENRTQSANTIFKFENISEEEVLKYKLYEYPDIKNGYYQKSILGAWVPDTVQRKYQYLNGITGAKHQARVYILYFWNQPRDVMYKQRAYWKGGNKNELVVCVGMNRQTKKVVWVDTFSWCKNPMAEIKIKSWFTTHPNFNLNQLYPDITKYIQRDWYRREFKDFNYIKLEMSENQVFWLWVILSIINVGVAIFVVKNGIDREN